MKALILMCLMLVMTGCAAVDVTAAGSRVPVQFATLKVIESSDSITAQDVLNHTIRVRQVVTSDVDLNITALVADAIARVGLEQFDASDRLLLQMLFYNIEQAVADVRPDMPLDEQRVRLMTLLNWIDSAARMAL